jgi:tetratricopeptide (TPR) repeat protein
MTTLGEVYATSGELDKAMAMWQKALDAKPDALYALYNMGLGYFQQGKPDEAKEMWKKCIKVDPTYLPAYKNYATASAMAGDLEEAIGAWKQAHAVTPALHEPYMALGDLYFRAGQFDEAGKYVTQLVDKMDQADSETAARMKELRASVELLYGSILLAQGNAGEGAARWAQAMGYDPNFALANATFIGKTIWRGLVEAAAGAAKNEDQRKAASLVGSLVSDDVKPPLVSEKEPEAAPAKTEKKKGGFSWFFRGKN